MVFGSPRTPSEDSTGSLIYNLISRNSDTESEKKRSNNSRSNLGVRSSKSFITKNLGKPKLQEIANLFHPGDSCKSEITSVTEKEIDLCPSRSQRLAKKYFLEVMPKFSGDNDRQLNSSSSESSFDYSKENNSVLAPAVRRNEVKVSPSLLKTFENSYYKDSDSEESQTGNCHQREDKNVTTCNYMKSKKLSKFHSSQKLSNESIYLKNSVDRSKYQRKDEAVFQKKASEESNPSLKRSLCCGDYPTSPVEVELSRMIPLTNEFDWKDVRVPPRTELHKIIHYRICNYM